jgi:dephospho-CoA kinase
MNMENRVVAALGMPGAGKSEFVAYLTNTQRVPSVYFGEVTLDEMDRRGLKRTAENEKFVRNDIRAKEGQGVYASRIIPEIETHFTDGHTRVIADGLYSWDEYKIFSEHFNDRVLFVAIVAARNLRHQRLANRPVRPLTPMQAAERDLDQLDALNSGNPIANADYAIVNDGSLNGFYRAINRTLQKAQFLP